MMILLMLQKSGEKSPVEVQVVLSHDLPRYCTSQGGAGFLPSTVCFDSAKLMSQVETEAIQ